MLHFGVSRSQVELQVLLQTSEILVAESRSLVEASHRLRECVSAIRRVIGERRQKRADHARANQGR